MNVAEYITDQLAVTGLRVVSDGFITPVSAEEPTHHFFVLGVDHNDERRMVVMTPNTDEDVDSDDIHVGWAYRCQVCGWEQTCAGHDSAGGCHS